MNPCSLHHLTRHLLSSSLRFITLRTYTTPQIPLQWVRVTASCRPAHSQATRSKQGKSLISFPYTPVALLPPHDFHNPLDPYSALGPIYNTELIHTLQLPPRQIHHLRHRHALGLERRHPHARNCERHREGAQGPLAAEYGRGEGGARAEGGGGLCGEFFFVLLAYIPPWFM